jgi:N-acetylmuramoyl-L-alanine amidase
MVAQPKQFITGTTCNNCTLTINGNAVKIYNTGVFAYTANLKNGVNNFELKVVSGKKQITQNVVYNYQPKIEDNVNAIKTITTEPNADMAIQVGETIQFTVLAKSNHKLQLNNGFVIKENIKSKQKDGYSLYEASYILKKEDEDLGNNWMLQLSKNNEVIEEKKLTHSIEVFKSNEITIGTIKNEYTPIYIGLGEDRLGGTKSGFLDSGVKVQVVGKIGKLYKVKFTNHLHQYVPTSSVEIESSDYKPTSLSNNITVTGDSLYDYVRVGLNHKLPYLSKAYTKPNKLILQIFGATSNSNWMMQFPEKLQTIKDVDIDQLNDHHLQIAIELGDKQLWGYQTFYEGNTLILAIRKQKQNLELKNLTIAIDAGHGGSNEGAKGAAGKYEKEFTLLIAKEVQAILQKEGANIIMTRNSDVNFENQERLNMLRKKMPDFAISIHLNSAGDPFRVKGTSTYYKHTAYKGLSEAIYKRMLETGLQGWGNIGNFNFFLNSATEFPTALVETLFISNPEDEEKVHQASFRKSMAEKIVLGIKDWLKTCAQ